MEEKRRGKGSWREKIGTILGIVLCTIFLPILILNCVLLFKGFINEDEVPSIGGVSPLIVLTDSMYPQIKSGDLIFCEKTEAEKVEVGDVISFFDPSGGASVVTHRVIAIDPIGGVYYFQTQGDNNNIPDRKWVPEENLVGEWMGTRLAGVGRVALFMQSTGGLIVCIGAPLALLVAYDLVRRKKAEKIKQMDMNALLKELNELKTEKEKTETLSLEDETE